MRSWWQSVRKIATLPNTKLTPTVVLARSLEKAQKGRIRSVVVLMEFETNDDGSEDGFVTDHSNMPVSCLALHAATARRLFERTFFDEQ